ncbi:MAG: DNA repair protein RadA, partial [Rhodospirillaceae bacterium]|nr:DNA repair protein RadA [Rhodospirillaceae bacterium]
FGDSFVGVLSTSQFRDGLENWDLQFSPTVTGLDRASLEEVANDPTIDAGVVIIDSIQTMFVDSLDSAPGTVTQVRASAQELIRLAKRRGFSVILVGHVTKDGQIAGPRVLEHMVDSVLYFEGERSHQFRILRAVKNRFGPTDEIGVFEMTDKGLMEVTNPSALFLTEHEGEVNGAAVFAGMEGTRPMLVELQTLIAPSPLGTPRRAVVGWDSGRLLMVLAVLEARCGLAMGANDVYLNVAGGLRVTEPAADLAVAAALASSLSGIAVPPETVVFGEIGLSGEVRSVAHTDARLKEAEKLGFTKVVMPKRRGKKTKTGNLEIREIGHLVDLLSLFHAPGKSNNKQAHG